MNIQFPSPQPPASSPPLRSGVTLAEVLISMGILAIGLLGAAAMFPVGGYFMQKGEIADRGAAIAQAAFADMVARGDLSPENWRAWDGATYKSMGDMTRTWMAGQNRNNELAFQKSMNDSAGFIYMIDPLGTAGGFRSGLNPASLLITPAQRPTASIPAVAVDDDRDRWTDFEGAWPVRRLCTKSMVMGNRIPSEPVALSIYSSNDDLAFSVDDEEVATKQRVITADVNSDGTADAITRESRGDYSWMAMVAPTQSDAREALMLNPSAYYFDVSVIVFYKRPLSTINTTEALVNGEIVSTGTGGGEIFLDSAGIANAYEDFKSGQWVLVSGPHTSSTPREPLFFSQWYRVLAIDDEKRTGGRIIDTETQRVVGLRGPDWPWNPGATVRVGLFPGAVAVHTKTMRLESLGEYTN